MRRVWQPFDPLAIDSDVTDAGSASSPRVLTLISAFERLVISRPTRLGISAQIHGVGIPASYSQMHLS